jgi:hypothetical protein
MWICREAFNALDVESQREWLDEVREIDKIRIKEGITLYFRAGLEEHFDVPGAKLFEDMRPFWYINNIYLL